MGGWVNQPRLINAILFYLIAAAIVIAAAAAVVLPRERIAIGGLLAVYAGLAVLFIALGALIIGILFGLAGLAALPMIVRRLLADDRSLGAPSRLADRAPVGIVISVSAAVVLIMIAWSDPLWRGHVPAIEQDGARVAGPDLILTMFIGAVLLVATFVLLRRRSDEE